MSPATLPATLLLATLLGAPTTAPAPTAPPAATPSAEPPTCTGTLSGAVTASFTCTVTARIEGTVATVTIAADGPVAGLRALKPATVSLPMPVPPGTYAGAALRSASSSVETASGASFAAGAGKGAVTLDVVQAERYRQAPNNLVMSGSLQARLVPPQGGQGEVLVEVRF